MRKKVVLKSVLLASACCSVLAFQAAAQEAKDVSIPAGDLATALQQYVKQTGVELVYRPEQLKGLKTNGVHGSLTPHEAVEKLIQNTSLELSSDQTGVLLIIEPRSNGGTGSEVRQEGVDTLDEVRVVGRRVDTMSMMKRGESFLETPQAVTVMDQRRIHDQQLSTVSEVMEQVPGITVSPNYFGTPDVFYSRGFSISNTQIDGTSVDAVGYYFSPNLAAYEQVEVLRGADGLFAGNGDPGGTINLSRKRAKAQPRALLDLSAGSWSNYSAQLDVTGPLAWDGRLRGRAVARWHDRDFFYDPGKDRGTFLYGTVEGDLTDNTVVIAGASVEDGKRTPWGEGLPRYKDGSALDISRKVALNADWSTWETDAKEFFLRVEHAFNDRWQLAANVTRGESQVHMISASVNGYVAGVGAGVDPNEMLGTVWAMGYDYDSQRTLHDISLQGKFDLFGHEHSVLIGYDRQRLDNISMPMAIRYGSSYWGPQVDISTFDSSSIPYPDTVYIDSVGNNQTRQEGMYAKLQLQLAKPLKLILGGRYFNYDYFRPFRSYDQAGVVTASGSTGYKEDGIFNPYGGLLFDLSDHWVLYGSVTEIYRVQSSYLAGPPPGTTLDPMTGRNYEIGTKAELRDGQLGFSAALYRIERNGQAERDNSYPASDGGAYTGNCCYMSLGEVVSQGVDLELTGELLPGWSFTAGYTYNDNENRRSTAVFQSLSPKHIFKLWSTYVVPGTDHRLSVGGGLTTQSSRYVSGTVQPYNPDTGTYDGPETSFEFTQGGYAVVNAMARYKLNDTWSAALNLNNLLDRTYYRGVGDLWLGNYYGEPRNFVLSLRGTF